MAKKPSRKELDALEKAQDIVYSAWEESSQRRRLALAEKAVGIGPLCDSETSFEDLALELRKLTALRRQTPSELLLREGRDER